MGICQGVSNSKYKKSSTTDKGLSSRSDFDFKQNQSYKTEQFLSNRSQYDSKRTTTLYQAGEQYFIKEDLKNK